MDNNVAAEEKVVAKRTKKEYTEEAREIVATGVEKLKEYNLSENFKKVLDLVVVWPLGNQAEAVKEAKEAVIEAFGGIDAFKDYISGDFQAELEALFGAQKALSILNNIKSFYSRRKSAAKKSRGTVKVSIEGKMYKVSKAYMEELTGSEMTKEEKVEAILAHDKTKPLDEEVIDILG